MKIFHEWFHLAHVFGIQLLGIDWVHGFRSFQSPVHEEHSWRICVLAPPYLRQTLCIEALHRGWPLNAVSDFAYWIS